MKRLLLLLASMTVLAATAASQTYPARPITIIVPYAAGGPTDVIARLLAESMKGSLGQPMIVENVSGAGGTIGVGRAARAAPDGYTISIGHVTTHVLNAGLYSLNYDVLTDFAPVALVSSSPGIILSRRSLPARNLQELIGWLKANPDKATAATLGAGSELLYAYFQRDTGTRFRLVPYRGAAPATQDLIAGHIDLLFTGASTVLPHVRSGEIQAHAVLARQRWFAAPDVPTTSELGFNALEYSLWHGLWVPKDTPADVIARLNKAAVAALADKAVRDRLTQIGQEIPPPERQTPEALGAYQRAEAEKWLPIIKAAGIKAQ